MATYPITFLDVFAIWPLEGNLLAVIHDADGVSTETMQTLARRFNLAETSFIQTASESGATYRHRIFTVSEELPFAGHPSVGTAVAWAYRTGDTSAHYVQQTGSGLQELWVERDDRHAIAKLRQNPVVFGNEIESTLILRALGLSPSDAHSSLPAQVASTGLPTTVVPLNDPAALKRIEVDWPAFRRGRPGTDRAQLLCGGGSGSGALGGAHVRGRYPGRGRRRHRLGGRTVRGLSA